MAFLDSEIRRIRHELGFNTLAVGAEPYVSVTLLFEQVVQANTLAGAATTSTTSVTAASAPTPVTLTLASATGFQAGQRVVVDVDANREVATVRSISGATAVLLLQKAHTGTYPVEVESGETITRETLARIDSVKSELAGTFGYGALKKVDEIEFYDTSSSLFGTLGDQLMYWRDELASTLGVPNMWRGRQSAGASLSLY